VLVSETQEALDGTQGMMAMQRIDLKKPSLGISKQIEGDDMVLHIRRRGIVDC
jgi:hypothetical protein